MRIRFTGAIVALAGAAVVTMAVMPIAGQAPQGGDGERRRLPAATRRGTASQRRGPGARGAHRR